PAMRFFAALAAGFLCGGCGQDLPSASFIDKLRVLAVQAEPPEVAPGEMTHLRRLAVEPPVPSPDVDAGALQPISTLWLACRRPPGVARPPPGGIGPASAAAIDGGTLTPPPDCAAAPGAALCRIGETDEVDYTPDRSSLGSDGTGEVLITAVVSDAPGGAAGC